MAACWYTRTFHIQGRPVHVGRRLQVLLLIFPLAAHFCPRPEKCSGMRPWERMLPQAILQAADNGFDFRRYDSDRNCRLETYELGVVVIAAHPPVAGGNTECATCGATRRSGNYGACFEVSGIEFCANIAGLGEGVSTATAGLEIFHLLAPDFSGDFYGSGSGSVSLMGATIDRWREDLVTRYHLNPWHKMLAGWVEPLIVPILPQIPPASARLTAPGRIPSSTTRFRSSIRGAAFRTCF